MSIRRWIIGILAVLCAGSAGADDFSAYVYCNDRVLATTPEGSFLPPFASFTMRIAPIGGVASGADVTFWRVGCVDGTKTVTAVRITPDAQTPPSDVLGLRYYIVQGNAPRRPAQLYSYRSDVAGPTTGTLMFPALFVSSPLPEQIDGDPDDAFQIQVFDAANTLRGSINIPPLLAGSLGIVPQVGLWWNPSEPGSGYALDVKHGVLVVTVYSYTSNGEPMWYLASGPMTKDAFVGTIDRYGGGPCISCSYRTNSMRGNDGSIGITFNSSRSATLTLPGGRAISIVPQAF